MERVEVDVFSDVKAFQAGTLMYQQKTEKKSLPKFVPIFPYMYKNLDYGALIHDGNGLCDKVKFFLNGGKL